MRINKHIKKQSKAWSEQLTFAIFH